MSVAHQSPRHRRPTVLLGFSDDTGSADLARHLSDRGLRVLICPDPSDLATHAATIRPALIVTDFLVQPLDGFTLHRLLHATRPYPVMLRTTGASPSRRLALVGEIAGAVTDGP